jgi:transposase InsO family protein
MEDHRKIFSIKKMAQVFKVARAGYYKYLRRKLSSRKKQNEELLEKIKAVHTKSKKLYGSPRIHSALKKEGLNFSRKRIAKIMKKNGIQSKIRKKWKATAKPCLDATKIAPNIIKQSFSASAKNAVWLSDITYIDTQEGWLYVAAILDVYSRKIVGLGMSMHPNTDLIIAALKQAICHRRPQPGLILHSDRGTQYTSSQYKNILDRHGFVQSMSAKGNCYDNAPMESFFHTLKTEHVYFHKYITRNQAIQSIFEYVEAFYNRQRLHSSLGHLSPEEFEQSPLTARVG